MAIYGNSIYMVQESLEERIFENFDFVTEAVDKEKLKATLTEKFKKIKEYVKEKIEKIISFFKSFKEKMENEIKDKLSSMANATSKSLEESLYISYIPYTSKYVDAWNTLELLGSTLVKDIVKTRHIIKNNDYENYTLSEDKIDKYIEELSEYCKVEPVTKEIRIASIYEANKLAAQIFEENKKFNNDAIKNIEKRKKELEEIFTIVEKLNDEISDKYAHSYAYGETGFKIEEVYHHIRDISTNIEKIISYLAKLSTQSRDAINENKQTILKLYTAVNKVKSTKITDAE